MDSFRYGGGNLYSPVGSLVPRIPADCNEFGFVLNQPTDGPLAESPEFGQLFHAEMRHEFTDHRTKNRFLLLFHCADLAGLNIGHSSGASASTTSGFRTGRAMGPAPRFQRTFPAKSYQKYLS